MRYFVRSLLASFALCMCACQQPDPNYNPSIANPTYPDAQGHRPTVAIDETHQNFHTKAGKYQGFAKLLTADGYDVRAFTARFVPADCAGSELAGCAFYQALIGLDTFVISNAQAALSAREAMLIADWVHAGGSLMLIADHSPFPSRVQELAIRLGLDWRDSDHIDIEFFRVSDGTFNDDHPVALGRNADEAIPEVQSFRGSALTHAVPGISTVSIMSFPAGFTYTAPDGTTHPLDGLSQGMVVHHGLGRVYASGEAAMFTAQILGTSGQTASSIEQQVCGDSSTSLDECIAQVCPGADTECLLGFCPEGYGGEACLSQLDLMRVAEDDPTATLAPLRIGMQVTPYNERFLLNIMHFLDGLL